MSLAQMQTEPNAIITINGSPYRYCQNAPGLVCNGFRHYQSAYEWTQGKYTDNKRKRKMITAPQPCPHEYFNIQIFRGMKR